MEALPENPNLKELGPPHPTFLSFVIQSFGALGGGVFGTLIMLVIFLLSSSILKPVLTVTNDLNSIHPMFIFVLMAMIFVGALSSALISLLCIALSDRSQYQRISSTLVQAFVINIVIFILLAPVYVVASNIALQPLVYIAGLHLILSNLGSALALKIIAAHRYALLGIYSAILSILVSLGINLMIFQIARKDLTILLFAALPVIWGSFGLIEGALSLGYRSIYNLYGVDFLRSDITYGKDYATTEEEVSALTEEEQENLYLKTEKDLSGSDFLKGKRPSK